MDVGLRWVFAELLGTLDPVVSARNVEVDDSKGSLPGTKNWNTPDGPRMGILLETDGFERAVADIL